MHIAVNCDLGEGYGRWDLTADEQLLQYIDAANIACGFHAGDPPRIASVVQKAVVKGVSIGAHPSYPDRQGFGRRRMEMTARELQHFITYQVGVIATFARAYGGRLEHVKVHGALYHFAAVDEKAARAVVEGALTVDEKVAIVVPPASALEETSRRLGAFFVREAFADRAYTADGQLLARHEPGALLTDAKAIAEQVLNIVQHGRVRTVTGQWHPVQAETVCIHGDTPNAVDIARKLRTLLDEKGIRGTPVGALAAKAKSERRAGSPPSKRVV